VCTKISVSIFLLQYYEWLYDFYHFLQRWKQTISDNIIAYNEFEK
jgi:hypothetical protein